MLRIVMALATVLSGCLSGTQEECTPTSTMLRDTLYTNPPVPGATTIQRVEQRENNFGLNVVDLYWIPRKEAIGYRVYQSKFVDSPFVLVISGVSGAGTTSAWKKDIQPGAVGTVFYKVTGINNDGVEGPLSPHVAIELDQ